jgi:hypothetical protein
MKNTIVVSIFFFAFNIIGQSQSISFEELDMFEEGSMSLTFNDDINDWRIHEINAVSSVKFTDFMSRNCDLVLGGFKKSELKVRLHRILSNVREGNVKISFLTDEINGVEVKSACIKFSELRKRKYKKYVSNLYIEGFEDLVPEK